MQLALALDIGTTSLGAIAIDREGRVVRSVQKPNRAHVRGLPAGRAEQDPERIWTAVLETVSELAHGLDGSPVALGLTGQMHGILLADMSHAARTPLISWQDRRANEPDPSAAAPLLESFLAGCPPAALDGLGCRPAPGFGAVTLYVLRRRGELPTGQWTLATIADWVGARLCAASPRIDPS